MRYSHADWLLQALDVLAVSVDAVPQVGGGAGVLGGAERRRVSIVQSRVSWVVRSGALAPVLVPLVSFASLLSSSTCRWHCRRQH